MAVRFYFSGLGGDHKAAFWLVFVGGLVIYEVFTILQTWWLGYWALQYEKMPASEVKALQYALSLLSDVSVLTNSKFFAHLWSHSDGIRGHLYSGVQCIHTRNTESIQAHPQCAGIVSIISYIEVSKRMLYSTVINSGYCLDGSTEHRHLGLLLGVHKTFKTVCASLSVSYVVLLTS